MSEEELAWLQHLNALGQSQGYLTYAQVNESLPVVMVDPLEIEEYDGAAETFRHSDCSRLRCKVNSVCLWQSSPFGWSESRVPSSMNQGGSVVSG